MAETRLRTGMMAAIGAAAGLAVAAPAAADPLFVDNFDSGDYETVEPGGPAFWEASHLSGDLSDVHQPGREGAGTLELTGGDTDGGGNANLRSADPQSAFNFFESPKRFILEDWNARATLNGEPDDGSNVQLAFAVYAEGSRIGGAWPDLGIQVRQVLTRNNLEIRIHDDGVTDVAEVDELVNPNDPNDTTAVVDELFLTLDLYMDATDFNLTVTDEQGRVGSASGEHGLTLDDWSVPGGDARVLFHSRSGNNPPIESSLSVGSLTVVPEPGSAALLLASAGLLLAQRRRRAA